MEEIILEEKVQELAEARKFAQIREIFLTLEPADIAPLFELFPKDVQLAVYRRLPKELAAEVFVEMDNDMQEHLISTFSDKELKEVLDEMFLDDTVDIIEEMPATVVKRILKQSDADSRKQINELLKYPGDSAGSLMTPEYVSLKKEMTVAEAFDRIRKTGVDKETIYTCYVVDRGRHLLGVLTVKELLLADQDAVIEDIMETNIIFANTLDDKEDVANLFNKYGFLAIPVVDAETRLVGIVTFDDAIDVMQEASTEDFEKMAAVLPSDKTYLKTGILETFIKRIPWLMILMISATFTGMIISGFEKGLTAFPALISFIPMLMGTGGNSGSQASVSVIRALSLGDIEFSDFFRVLVKEFLVSVVCGVSLAAVNFAKIYFIDYMLLGNIENLVEMAVVCLALAVIVIVAKTIGSILPIVAEKLGFDPAVMAQPLMSTIVDVLSLIVYFGIASFILF